MRRPQLRDIVRLSVKISQDGSTERRPGVVLGFKDGYAIVAHGGTGWPPDSEFQVTALPQPIPINHKGRVGEKLFRLDRKYDVTWFQVDNWGLALPEDLEYMDTLCPRDLFATIAILVESSASWPPKRRA